MASLQEQLLKAGLADEKKAKQIKREKRKQAKAPKGSVQSDDIKLAAQQARQEKVERDRELARQQQARAEERAIQAQIKQLVEVNRIERAGSPQDLPYQFVHGTRIKKIHVNPKQLDQLARGLLAIVELEGRYELLPTPVAEKIAERDETRVILKNDASEQPADEDDPYADYQIPDDLMW